jgi:hypothetical protein
MFEKMEITVVGKDKSKKTNMDEESDDEEVKDDDDDSDSDLINTTYVDDIKDS